MPRSSRQIGMSTPMDMNTKVLTRSMPHRLPHHHPGVTRLDVCGGRQRAQRRSCVFRLVGWSSRYFERIDCATDVVRRRQSFGFGGAVAAAVLARRSGPSYIPRLCLASGAAGRCSSYGLGCGSLQT